jgi:hypothetical protein
VQVVSADYGSFTAESLQELHSGDKVAFKNIVAVKNVSINDAGTQITLPPTAHVWRIAYGIEVEGLLSGRATLVFFANGTPMSKIMMFSSGGFQGTEFIIPLAASAVLEITLTQGAILFSNSEHGYFTCMVIDSN